MEDLSAVESIAFSGGGVRGVAFCGALMAIRGWLPVAPERPGLPPPLFPRLRRASGTSVGGLFACATALRVSSERLFRLLDSEAILEGLAPKVDLQQLHRHYGLDSTRGLREGIRRVLEIGLPPWGIAEARAEGFTLGELEAVTGVEVSVCATRIGDEAAGGEALPRSEMFTSRLTPDLAVIDALTMSMAVPLLYQPVVHAGGVYVDGALLNNTPVTEDMDPETTLVLRVALRPLDYGSDGLQGYISAVLYTPMQWIECLKTRGFPHCIEVSSGNVKAFDFQAPRESLVAAALDGMVGTFRWLSTLPQ